MNLAKPQRIKEGSTRPVWSDDNWLQQHAGETIKDQLNQGPDKKEESDEAVRKLICNRCLKRVYKIFYVCFYLLKITLHVATMMMYLMHLYKIIWPLVNSCIFSYKKQYRDT